MDAMSTSLPALPPASCDGHVHVVGDRSVYPMANSRHYTPPLAHVADLRSHLARIGFDRAVIVQPSIYGVDNRCMLDALIEFGGAARGVAVLPETVDAAELRQFDAAGVRGVRLNFESSSLRDPRPIMQSLEAWARRIAPMGWHLQIYAALEMIAAVVPTLHRLPVTTVLDHFAMMPASSIVKDQHVQAVLGLLCNGPGYIKFSAPYRVDAGTHEGAAALSALAGVLVRARPERILWGSDWPHTNREAGKAAHEVSAYRKVDSARLLDDLHAWLPDATLRSKVLVDNPARLYGF